MPRCPLSPSLQEVHSSEGPLPLPLVPPPAPPRTSGQTYRGQSLLGMERGRQLPAFLEKEVTEEPGNEGEGRAETWGPLCFSLSEEDPGVSVLGGFQAQSHYEKEAAEKLLVFWTCSAEPVASRACLLSPFLVIFHLKTATLTPHPTQGAGADRAPFERVDSHLESRPGEGRHSMA